MAFEAKVCRTSFSMLARGEANPSSDVIEGISGALEISITTLFQEAERRHQPDRWLRADVRISTRK
jgi:transcriptional regulator with XRE-family HTH domain